MNIMKLFQLVFRCLSIAFALYYLIKQKYKIMGSLILVFTLSFLPEVSNWLMGIVIDPISTIIYLIILFMALYLGSCLGYYDRYWWWDRTIHFLSGVGFTGFGAAIVKTNADSKKAIILLFGFTFSVTLQVIWEVLEYISDCLTHGNAQRWQKIHASVNHVNEKAIQPAGLVDTMNDTICCMIGAGLAFIIWWFIL
jgi:hypothetical protein